MSDERVGELEQAFDACIADLERTMCERDKYGARIIELETIVRAIAELDPVTTLWSPGTEKSGCDLCGSYNATREEVTHPDDCPWVMARKAMGL